MKLNVGLRPFLFVILLVLGLLSEAFGQGRPMGLPGGLSGMGRSGGGGSSAGGGRSVIDDSTKVIYGPRTTLYRLEKDLIANQDSTLYRVDTLLTDLHRWQYDAASWHTYTDLGNLGTAMRPIFLEPRREIGIQLGFRAYERYAIQPEDVRYYDTKSPHTDMTFVMGGRGQNILRFGFTQNINPRLNMGFKVQRFTSTKQYGTFSTINSEALLAQNWTFLYHSSYFSKNQKYSLLAHFRHLNHEVREQGGVLPDSTETGVDPFIYDGRARISDRSNAWERRNDLYLYHQYKLNRGFQGFHRLESGRVRLRYTDSRPQVGFENNAYQNLWPSDTDTLRYDVGYRLISNTIGVKGSYGGFTYRAFLKQRLHLFSQTSRLQRPIGESRLSRFETIPGLWLSYYFKDSTQHLTAQGEYSIGRDFRLSGNLNTRWFKANANFSGYSPDLIMQNNLGVWENDFKLTLLQQLDAQLPLRFKRWQVEPTVIYQLITNYLYYNSEARPEQFEGSFSTLRVGLKAEYQSPKWTLRLMGYYTANSNTQLLRIPPLWGAAQLTRELLLFKVLYLQVGLAAQYRSTYLGDAYMPLTQQFYLQNQSPLAAYVATDAFVNYRINRVRMMLKFTHLNQGLSTPGYFTTPGYLAMRRIFSFGVFWPLFN